MSPPRLLSALAAALLLVTAAPAAATTVDALGGGLEVKGGPGEANTLRISLGVGVYTVTESAPFTPLWAGFGCTQASGARVTCSAVGVNRVFVEAGDGADSLVLDADIAAILDDGPGNDTIAGGPRGDVFVGSPGDDVLSGGGGDDQFGDTGGQGADTVDGGTGRDTADYAGRSSGIAVSLDGLPGDGAPGESDDVEPTVEDVRGGSGADRLTGSDHPNLLRGNAGDDVFDGRGGADRFEGGAGRDLADYATRATRIVVSLDGVADDAGEGDNVTGDVEGVRGGMGDDELIGSGESNRLDGGGGRDTLDGGADADELAGGDGDDVLDGGSGDDDLQGGAGTDAYDGGDGSDAVDYRDRGDALTIDTASGRGAGGERMTDVEGVLAGSGDDRLTGDAGDGRVDGGPGDDVLDGGAGRDVLAGGPGRDRVSYATRDAAVTASLNDNGDDGEIGEGDDVRTDVEVLVGGDGADRLSGGSRDDLLLGGVGDDRLGGGDGADTLEGGDGNDTLEGNAGHDRVSAAAGNDRLYGHDGDDALDGGSGNDGVNGGNGTDALTGAAGDDRLNGEAGDDPLDGGDGDDRLDGGDGADALVGASGRDELNGGNANDTASGGDGDDRLSGNEGDDRLDGGAGADRVGGGNGADDVAGGPDGDKVSGDPGDDRVGGGDGADELTGGDGNDTLDGGDGDDRTDGSGGDDVLLAGGGADRMDGGSGEDTVDYGARTVAVRVSNDDKADDGQTGERDDVRSSVDHVIGGAGNDVLSLRTDWPHRIYGEGGDDLLDGGPKPDQLVGGPGRDQLLGRGGKDIIDGGAGNDRLNGADTLAEQLRCGAGKDVAIRDRVDKGVGCETLRVGKPLTDGGSGTATPAGGGLEPATGRPGTQTGVRRTTARGRFVAIPGSPGERIDSRLLRDIAWMKVKYRIAITDGFAMSGHARDGEHPVGLALDIVPGPGGTWADIDRLAKWAEPRRNRPRAPFRWVGYNGDRGHGRGHHLHLSWNHARVGRGRTASWIDTLVFRGNRPVLATGPA